MTFSVDVIEEAQSTLTPEQIEAAYPGLEEAVVNPDGTVTLDVRFRAIFTLKAIGTVRAMEILGRGFADRSALFKHELAYVLGQMKNPLAIAMLADVLADRGQDPMVRHEAGEALGAIGDPASVPLLVPFLQDDADVVRETCELAVAKIRLEQANPSDIPSSVHEHETTFDSVDPAPPLKENLPVERLRSLLLDASLPLFDRYRAMFSLRNKATKEAVLALCSGFDDKSALFKHEIAYVLGQLQHPASVPALARKLADVSDVGMVRHECAEALGSIATAESLAVLQKFKDDPEEVVRESCVVALDMFEHQVSGEFQYANGIERSA